MKKPMVYLAAAAVVAAPLMATDPAHAAARKDGGASDIQSFCRELVASGDVPGLSMGECVSLNISSDSEKGGFVAHRCDNWRDAAELELAGFSSYADCIRRFTP
ncbi:hypothetical protein [Sphingomonas sp.]|uniref:hypothetical protein n=1 Tax=Sphingomonas sp. TaxID=28214 RepID=UPI00286E5E62|nr:hypothetical protein [Sphingomonas sp.]